jgi:peptidyl-prolyl cis-trans isomerase B (cyclophilin B)
MMMRHDRIRRIALLACACAFALGGCGNDADNAAPAQPSESASSLSVNEEQPVEYVLLTTTQGDILLELDRERAPLTVASFLQYVADGFYDGTIFHRVIPGFMIQGGGFTSQMQQKLTRGNVRNESSNGLLNDRGTIAMARTGEPHSASSQFFINVADNDFLNRAEARDGWGYAVFGKVIAGMSAVDAIVAMPTGRVGQHEAVPREPVIIQTAKRMTKAEADAKKSTLE